ncbi:MAG: DNA-protecting protein DprA [Bacteroidota bacterium]|jgi:DNA processing protein
MSSQEQELIYAIALSQVPQIGPIVARQLLKQLGSATDVFSSKLSHLQAIHGVGQIRAEEIKAYKNFDLAEKELAFAQKHQIEVLSINNGNYPSKLLNCIDAPTVLYYKGDTQALHNDKTISIVGKRKCTDYGRRCVDDLLHALKGMPITVFSGLAIGIDIHAHKKALVNQLPTIGVLAHGLDTIYPSTHRNVAKQMLVEGGLLTEYISGTQPDRENFPTRNRIVAGISDVTIVIETDVKGGSMITANLANGYNKDVMAYPGDIYTDTSAGCNQLIKSNRAHMITCAQDLLDLMNWEAKQSNVQIQRQLFIELNDLERVLYDFVSTNPNKHVDEVAAATKLTPSQLASATLSLELQGVLTVLPGKVYKAL